MHNAKGDLEFVAKCLTDAGEKRPGIILTCSGQITYADSEYVALRMRSNSQRHAAEFSLRGRDKKTNHSRKCPDFPPSPSS